MLKPLRLLLPLLLMTSLASCHTDPFSMKPEVRGVTIPDRSAEPEPAQEPEEPADQPAG